MEETMKTNETTKPWPTIDNVHGDRFHAGIYSSGEFARDYVTRLFDLGLVERVEDAFSYAICYGELCAYRADRKLLCILSVELPDNEECLDGRTIDEDVERLKRRHPHGTWYWCT